MTDRELLKLAAKAAGLAVRQGSGQMSHMLFVDPSKADPDGVVTGVEWNPLADDGDALRLAVKLGILLLTARGFSVANSTDSGSGGCVVRIAITDGADLYAPTRRAVVRAAASIGASTGDKP